MQKLILYIGIFLMIIGTILFLLPVFVYGEETLEPREYRDKVLYNYEVAAPTYMKCDRLSIKVGHMCSSINISIYSDKPISFELRIVEVSVKHWKGKEVLSQRLNISTGYEVIEINESYVVPGYIDYCIYVNPNSSPAHVKIEFEFIRRIYGVERVYREGWLTPVGFLITLIGGGLVTLYIGEKLQQYPDQDIDSSISTL